MCLVLGFGWKEKVYVLCDVYEFFCFYFYVYKHMMVYVEGCYFHNVVQMVTGVYFVLYFSTITYSHLPSCSTLFLLCFGICFIILSQWTNAIFKFWHVWYWFVFTTYV